MDNEVEVMRVLRVPPRGKLVILVGKNRFQQISQVRDPSVKQRLLAAIGELVIFADGYEALEAAGVAPPLSVELPESNQPVSHSLEERQATFLASLERERDVMYVSDAESSGSEHPVGVTDSDRTGGTGPLSIVGQINPILQKHIAENENLQGRKIELEQDPSGGLFIDVDGKYYRRPDEIEDADVRSVLRSALREWDSN
jgi:hypothetical protein